MRAVLAKAPGPRRWVLASIFPGQVLYFTRPQRARRLGPVLAWKRPRHSATASARRFRNRCFEHCMTRTIPAAAGSPGDPLASTQHALSGAVPVASGAAIRTGILWMLVATVAIRLSGFNRPHLAKSLSGDENRLGALLRSHGFGQRAFISWRDPRLMISRRPLLQMLRSSFLLGAALFGMFALNIMPLVDFSAIVWVTPRSRRRARSSFSVKK